AGGAGVLEPHEPRCEPERGELFVRQPEVGQVVALLRDPVPLLLLAADNHGGQLQGDADLPESVLVPLEHPLEGVPALAGVAGHGVLDLLDRDRAVGLQQEGDQVEEALGLADGHSPAPAATTAAAPAARWKAGSSATLRP